MTSTKAKSKAVERYCNAPKKVGGRCRLPAGWGTEHPGRGPCRKHLGNTPTVRRRYARDAAVEQARRFLDSDVDIDPLEAALYNVRVAHGVVLYRQAKLRALEHPNAEDERALEDALRMAQTVNRQAIDAGATERLVQIAERQGEKITLAAEAMLAALIAAGVAISAKQRAEGVRVFHGELLTLEAGETV